MSYLSILILVFIFSVILELAYRVHLYHTQRERVIVTLIFLIVGICWDTYGTINGHWLFRKENLTGFALGALPLEEYLFFLIVPYFILTVYKVLDLKIKIR